MRVNPDIGSEDCAAIGDWTDSDAGDGASTQVTFDSKSCFKMDGGSAGSGNYALRTRDLGTFPDGSEFYFEISLYHDLIGSRSSNNDFQLNIETASNEYRIRFASDGLWLRNTAGSWAEVGTNLVEQDTWQTWIFHINTADDTTTIYLNGTLQASDQSHGTAGAYVTGRTDIQQRGNSVANTITYVDYINVGTYPIGKTSGWYSENWTYRQKVTIDGDKIASNESNYPVLLAITDSDNPIFSNLEQGDASDLVITTDDGETEATFELDYYSSTNYNLIAHILAATITAGTDLVFYIYYGNADWSTDLSDANAVFGSSGADFEAVWHMDDFSPTSVTDSTGNGHNGAGGTAPSRSYLSDLFGIGYQFDLADSEYIHIGDEIDMAASDFTFEAIIYVDSGGSTTRQILAKYYGAVLERSYQWAIVSNETLALVISDDGSNTLNQTGSTALPEDEWCHVAAVKVSDDMINYRNGQNDGNKGSSYASLQNNVNKFGIGASIRSNDAAYNFFQGRMAEVRVSKSARNAGWIETTYNFWIDQSNIVSLGAEKTIDNFDAAGGKRSRTQIFLG